MTRNIFFLLALAGLMSTGCSKDNLTPAIDRTTVPRTLGEFIENNYDLSLLRTGLQKAGLLDSLKLPGAWTFFAPDNTAFNAMGIISEKDFDNMNTDSLRFMLGMHIISDRYFISSFPQQLDNRYKSRSGPELYVSVGQGAFGPGREDQHVFVNGTIILAGAKRNISLANGVMHILRRPLKYTTGTVQDYITADTSLTLFASVMKKFGYWEGFKTKNPLTIYAPDNAAFLTYGLTADSIAKMNPSDFMPLAFGVYALMMNPVHVFSTDGYAISGGYTDASDGIRLDKYSLIPIYFYNLYYNNEEFSLATSWLRTDNQWAGNDAGPVTVNYKGGLLGADHLTTNGIVHVIDDLIFIPALMRK